MIVGGAAAAALVPPAKAAILLIAFHFAVCSHDFMALIHGPLKVWWGNPIVLKVHAHSIFEIHSHLDSVVGIDAVAFQASLLTDSRQRYRFTLIIVADQIDPMRTDVAEWVTLLHPFE